MIETAIRKCIFSEEVLHGKLMWLTPDTVSRFIVTKLEEEDQIQ